MHIFFTAVMNVARAFLRLDPDIVEDKEKIQSRRTAGRSEGVLGGLEGGGRFSVGVGVCCTRRAPASCRNRQGAWGR